jgi:hypothetical protein
VVFPKCLLFLLLWNPEIHYSGRKSPLLDCIQSPTSPIHAITHYFIKLRLNIVKPVLNGPFIKRNSVLNGNIFRSRDYHSIPWLNGNLASAEMFCTLEIPFKTGFTVLAPDLLINIPCEAFPSSFVTQIGHTFLSFVNMLRKLHSPWCDYFKFIWRRPLLICSNLKAWCYFLPL